MSAVAQASLALLLLLQQPGRSPYSTIDVATCDDTCQRTPICTDEIISCAAPKWSPRRKTFYRLETHREGVLRYADIADVIAQTASVTDKWLGKRDDLIRLLVTVAYHESGFRRDVHEGSLRGDCDYHVVAGVREAIPGSCRSACLGQIYLMPDERTSRGYRADDLVGLDRASTQRCVQTMADKLADANRACNAQQTAVGVHAACTFGMYGGVASYSSDARIAARYRTYQRLRYGAAKLSPEIQALLRDKR